jgi:hypothetical protein
MEPIRSTQAVRASKARYTNLIMNGAEQPRDMLPAPHKNPRHHSARPNGRYRKLAKPCGSYTILVEWLKLEISERYLKNYLERKHA